MKRIVVLLFLLCQAASAGSQASKNGTVTVESENRIGVYGGMGIHLTAASSVVRYINAVAQSSGLADDWGTSVEFFGGVEVPVGRSWGVKIEHSLLFKSYTLNAASYNEDLRYDIHAPMIMGQYVIPGKGYFVKVSAGGGYHWGTVVTRNSIFGVETLYRAHGPGMRLEAEGQTAFDAHLFGYISGSLGFESLGRVASDDGRELTNGSGSVSLNYFTAGVRFGLMYYF